MSEQCSKAVYDSIASWGSRPCTRKGAVFEDDKWYCNQHSKAGVASRRAKQENRWAEQDQAYKKRDAERQEHTRRAECFPDLLAALRPFALECGDPDETEYVLVDVGALQESETFPGRRICAKNLREARAAVKKGEGA